MKNVIVKLVRRLWIVTIAAAAIGLQQSASFGVEIAPAAPPPMSGGATGSDAVAKFRAEEQLAWDKWRLQKQKAELYQANSPTLGATQPKVSIIEFFDYNCHYCRRVQPLLLDYLRKNPDAQIILKDVAFLGKESLAVGKIVAAARKQKDISELHNALMNAKGLTTEASALSIAGSMGFDIQRLKNDAASDAVNSSIQDTQALAMELRVTGTPLFIIGHTIISGAGADLQEMVAKAVDDIRKNGCDIC